MISTQERILFQETVCNHYRDHGRHDLPWRRLETDGTFDPYKIMVSELMLQQTQVGRVAPKYAAFLERFPTLQALAQAELGDVLRAWQGLGYNRRAKFLWQAARQIVDLGAFPTAQSELVRLPGIGPNTAGAILAYAYNLPELFIETNIRTVYLHYFLQGRSDVSDKTILALLEQTLDRERPRTFYWALMDYGSHLKTAAGNPNKASKHYAKQSSFQGSRRQIRGRVMRELGDGTRTFAELQQTVDDERLESVLQDLMAEGLIRAARGVYSL